MFANNVPIITREKERRCHDVFKHHDNINYKNVIMLFLKHYDEILKTLFIIMLLKHY